MSYLLKTFPKRLFTTKSLSVSNILIKGRENVGAHTTVKGWIKNVRVQKELVFADLNDGSSAHKLQLVLPKSLLPDNLGFGCAVKVSGDLNISPRGTLELAVKDINVYGECNLDENYPFRPRKSYSSDYCRQFLHYRPRTNYNAAVMRIRNRVTIGIHNFFQCHGFINVHAPILTSNDCEGAGELFKVVPDKENSTKDMRKEGRLPDTEYFNTKAFLTVSGQLHLEALCRGLGNCYTFGPCFRAENSKSRLHLTEFSMIEAEVAFCERLEDLLEMTEKLIKGVFECVHKENNDDLNIVYDKNIPRIDWLHRKFDIITHKNAVEICNKHSNALSSIPNFDESLNKEQELFLVKHCNGPVFVVEWPKHLKSFYMKENENDCGKVDAFDLLAPITGEIVGGSLREDNYHKLSNKLPSNRLNWYLDLRRYGNIPTGGFGLGLERLIQWICHIENIKDTVPFPRWPHNCQM